MRLAVLLLVLAGCVTGYRHRGNIGKGYWEEKLAPGVYRVHFLGDNNSLDQVRGHVVRRARELCAREGFQRVRVDRSDTFSGYESGVRATCMTQEEHDAWQAAERGRQLSAPSP